ncbi:MAG: long-chain fatty acid--CoA ligase [Deltaproteobacteria bacterium]|nr:long-chain fatty acid--CoA ligase [Deltaproteobacteria bacterium]
MEHFDEITMAAVFQNRALENGEKACVAYRNGAGEWFDVSWNRMNDMIHEFAYHLLDRGIRHGDKVAVFSPNRFEWWVADMAILSIGAVNIPIYATNTPEEVRYILDDSDARICCAGTEDHLRRVLSVRKALPKLEEVVVFDEIGGTYEGVLTMGEAFEQGRACRDEDEFDRRLKAIRPDDLCTFIYTSGTTGDPKGVMLSHHNIMSNVHQFKARFPEIVTQQHRLPSFLPLSHAVERTAVYYCQVYSANKVCFVKDITTLLEDLQAIRPTFMASVPRVLEKMYDGIHEKVAQAPPLKKKLFEWAKSVGARNLPYICNGKKRGGLFALEYNLADRLIFSKLKKALGLDRIYFIGLGGAPMLPHVLEFFLGIGISCCDAYGLSETSPVVTCNYVGHIRPGTVGMPVPDTEIRIGDDGELLIKGPQVMVGYYKNEAATREAMTSDGYLRSGDIGELDAEGNLRITGRIKDILITSGGKNISPQNLENAMLTSEFIEQVAVIGDSRKYLSALVVPVFEILEPWARKNNIGFTNREELIGREEVKDLFDREIKEKMGPFGRVEQIKKFTLMPFVWTQETGELTPTLKVKRRVLAEKYAKEINAMYMAEQGSKKRLDT